ncbi:MAG TPA: class I adenylate-forming enzyme family protein [Verrucomicrobiae bacterium]|jgi:long-chain acyl-CoA synthetase
MHDVKNLAWQESKEEIDLLESVGGFAQARSGPQPQQGGDQACVSMLTGRMALAYAAPRHSLGDMNLTELLDKAASDWPKRIAVIEGNSAVSYTELVENTLALATQLRTLQLSANCRVGLYFPNSVNYVSLTFALWRINAVVVPIPTECTEAELSDIAAKMQLEGILSQKPRAQSVALRPDVFLTRLTPALPSDNHGLNLAFIRFTSGTTSVRKGVALCHETITGRVMAANQALRIGPADTVMWCLPMSHHFLVTIVLYLSQGATIVLARHILSRPFLEAANRWKGTVLYAAPFHYSMLARDSSCAKLASVRLAVSTTCRLPQEVAVSFQQRFGLPLSQALGVIEVGLICVNVDDPTARWDSVGRPLPEYAVNIRHPDINGYGEVVVSGPGILDAYTNPWISRDQLMPDGWFATGDIGRIDPQGYLYLVGRKTAVINLAGRKVFPEEIEAVLNRHPTVRESRVYGTAHSHLGELVEAEVVLRDAVSTDALRDFCRVHLSSDKIPSRFHVVKLITKTAVTGKIRRQTTPPIA